MEQEEEPERAALERLMLLAGHLSHTLSVGRVVIMRVLLPGQKALTTEAMVVAAGTAVIHSAAMAVLVLSLSVTQTHMQMLYQPQGLQRLPTRVGIKFMRSQLLEAEASHFKLWT
jgi:hypothetical protein